MIRIWRRGKPTAVSHHSGWRGLCLTIFVLPDLTLLSSLGRLWSPVVTQFIQASSAGEKTIDILRAGRFFGSESFDKSENNDQYFLLYPI